MDDVATAARERRRVFGLRTVQTLGLLFSLSAGLLAWGRLGAASPGAPAWALFGAAAGVVAGFLVVTRARFAYYLFLLAGVFHLFDLVSGYLHALLFLGACMILGGLASINEPVDMEKLRSAD